MRSSLQPLKSTDLRTANMTSETGSSVNDREGSDGGDEVKVEEFMLSFSYQLETLIRVLEAKGVLSREELLAEFNIMLAEKPSAAKPSTSQVN
jgi:hypothetical protein